MVRISYSGVGALVNANRFISIVYATLWGSSPRTKDKGDDYGNKKQRSKHEQKTKQFILFSDFSLRVRSGSYPPATNEHCAPSDTALTKGSTGRRKAPGRQSRVGSVAAPVNPNVMCWRDR